MAEKLLDVAKKVVTTVINQFNSVNGSQSLEHIRPHCDLELEVPVTVNSGRKRHSPVRVETETKFRKIYAGEISPRVKKDFTFPTRYCGMNDKRVKSSGSRFKVPFTWSSSQKVFFRCCGRTIPPAMLLRYQKYLHSKKQTHPVFYPVLQCVDDSVNDFEESDTEQNNIHMTESIRNGNKSENEINEIIDLTVDMYDSPLEDNDLEDDYKESDANFNNSPSCITTESSTSNPRVTCPICSESFEAAIVEETHRPGSLKQQNKQHKHGRHRSKGSISLANKGKVAVKTLTRKVKGLQSKAERRRLLEKIRTKKQQDALMKKRQINHSVTAPFLIALVPLGFEAEPQKLVDHLMVADSDANVTYSVEHILHLSVPRWKQRFSFVVPRQDNLIATMDSLKVADTVVFVMSALSNQLINNASEKVLTCLLAQGLPSTAVVLLDIETVPIKKQNTLKQEAQRLISHWLPDDKVMTLNKNSDALNLLRKLGSQKQRNLIYRDRRPHILAEELKFICEPTADRGTLLVSGYLRGQSLSANSIVHIPGLGDFQLGQIDGPPDPHPLGKKKDMEDDVEILHVAHPDRQIPLISEIEPDPMETEQTWPTREELEEAREKKISVKRVPKGTSDYQACWIPDVEVSDDGDEDIESEMSIGSEDESDVWKDACEEVTSSEKDVNEKYDETLDADEEIEALSKLKAMREEAAFPDEIDTPQDVPARERFAKYRGLASFRTSPWDPKENLPRDYARIFQFANFDRTKKRILRDLEDSIDGVQPGGYVRLHIKNVPRLSVEAREEGEPLVVCGLLEHEHQMSLINLVVKRSNHSAFSQIPVKSKDLVVVHCGFRRYRARPIYSQHTNGSKHKYERFFQPDSTMIASLYAPITFPPAAVLLFTENGGLLATGRVLSANPDRLVIKRVVLSGHPFRVLKRHAIIRFMFFNREDIDWFKPVELHTKYGRRGHIREPLGTHGHFKAVFDDQLKSQDTVLMTLYKRVFPPWSYDQSVKKPPPIYKVLRPIIEDEEMKAN